MASGHIAVVYREIGRLFGAGTVSGLSEGQLLDRFVARRDGDAFEAIVARHGPMVLSVCRDHLRDPNDVDDAFQATFLVLVRRAGSLRHRDGLGNWLYGVARRVAKRAQIHAARRRDREGLGPEPVDPSSAEAADFELRPMIHDEVGRLPDSYRAAVVLCFFEGQTHEEAADRLGWPVGTVKGRLARAKDLLRDRLTRRGVSLPAGLLAVTLARTGEAALPPGLLSATVSASSSLARTIPLSSLGDTPGAIALTEGVLRTMIVTKLKVATTLIVALGVLSGSGVLAYQFGGGGGRGSGAAPAPNSPASPALPQSGPIAAKDASALLGNAQIRVKLAEEALANYQDLIKNGRLPANGPMAITWSRRLYEAKVDAGVPRADAAKEYLQSLESGEREAEERQKMGRATILDVMELRYQRIQAIAEINAPARPAGPVPPIAGMMPGMPGGGPAGGGGMMAAMGGQAVGAPAGGGIPATPVGQFPAGGGGGFGGEAAAPARPSRKEDPADLERNKAIQAQLNHPLSMSFPRETPLEDILKYIKSNTTDEKLKFPNGVPIYVDPQGLQEAEKTITSPVSLEIDGVPLRTTLRLILNQIGLDYRVRDGLVFISAISSLNEEDQEAEREAERQELMAWRKQRALLPGGTGGGMGGMGGGMGGPGGMGGMGGGFRNPTGPGGPASPDNQGPRNRPGGLQ